MKRILIYAVLGGAAGHLTGEGIKLLPKSWAIPVIFGLLTLALAWVVHNLRQILLAQKGLREIQRLIRAAHIKEDTK